ncbi:transmembrane emp24 domain-containing protein 6-like [Hoplias malabaricus]|uniref:transmembrane emp24 domain-containing protein 6-like n=1 Tax=Hoplias malabaricus TaxID=27720 RepID=UPI003461F4D2
MHSLVLLILLVLGHPSGSQKTEQSDNSHGGHQFLQWADHYDFAVQLPGMETQCYWHFARHGGRIYLTYMVQWASGMMEDRHLAASILSPKGMLISFNDDTKGQMGFQTTETGFYQMCFANYLNRFGHLRVFLNFGVYYEGVAEEVDKEDDMEEGVLNNTLSNIKDISNKMRIRIQHMWRFYNVARMRRGADFYLLQSKANYMKTWSIVQSFVILTAGYFQLYFLKRFFRTDNKRPCC